MIVRKLEDILGTDREIKGKTWESRRLVSKDDGMGHSLHDTIIKAGTETPLWYKNHFESVYCIEGEGSVEVKETGEVYPISAGTVYVLNQNDQHILRAKTQMRMVCSFTPPLRGDETHDKDGSYPLLDQFL